MAAVESTSNVVIVSKLLSFAALSVTVIEQSEYVPSLNELKVMVLSPESADLVLEEQGPSNAIDPDSVDENVWFGVLSLVGVVTAVTSAITGAVLSTLKNGSSLPQELMIMATLGISKMGKTLFIFFSTLKYYKNKARLRSLLFLMIYTNCQDLDYKIL